MKLKDKAIILILPADKGQSAVFMDMGNYMQKCKDLHVPEDENTYVKLPKLMIQHRNIRKNWCNISKS